MDRHPIKEWGDSLRAQTKNPRQEVGLLWVTVKPGKTYNAKWDLTNGATVPAPRRDSEAISPLAASRRKRRDIFIAG